MATNIIDKPRPEGSVDLLGVDKYINALMEFIRNCQMPTTIGIQGEWGSGKTSMLNQIRWNLCEMPGQSLQEMYEKPFYGIWINTWQYSLMKSREQTLTSILTGLTQEIVGIIKSKHENKTKEVINQVTGIFGKLIKTTAKAAINASGMDGDEFIDAFQSDQNKADLLSFKKSLTDAINKCLEEDRKQGNNNRGFIFFIDDLDRIDPPVAVEILELLKNIFEVDNCIFILAIDYEVVVKGLVPKFGPLTEKNEREFRSFFDKIIQLPFSMPIGSYDVSNFLIESLKTIGYITGQEDNLEDLNDMARKSVGTNPRSLKRLINTLSLIHIINKNNNELIAEKEAHDLLINFGLVCIQIAYPKIYEFLINEPDFTTWNSDISKKYNLPEISESDSIQIAESEFFSEEWQKILYRFCIKDIYLKNRAYDISELLTKIKDILVNSKKDVGQEISRILLMSAVTSVSVDVNAQKPKNTTKDTSKYSYKGNVYGKARLVLAVIKEYVENKPDITLEQLKEVFPNTLFSSKPGKIQLIMQESLIEEKDKIRYFNKPNEVIKLSDTTALVTTQWGVPNFTKFLDYCRTRLKLDIRPA